MSRTFDAPRELVFKAWTEPERLAQWWGPSGFEIRIAEFDLLPGGTFHYCLVTPDGNEMWGKFVYREIVAPERLVFVVSFSDAAGGMTRHPMSATWPLEVLSTITFSEYNGKTTLIGRSTPINASDEEQATFDVSHESMQQGFAGAFDQLAEYLTKA